MTALYMDGFDHYGTGVISETNMLAGAWAYSNFVTCTVPPWGPARTGSYCLANTGAAPSGNRYAVPTPGNIFIVSCGFACDNLSNGIAWPVRFATNTTTTILNLNILANGQIEVQNSTGAVIGITNGPIIKAENWHLLEMQINTSANTFILRVDDATGAGTPLISITDATITGTIALIGFIEQTAGDIAYIDDVFIRDNNGSVNNGFLGDRRVATVFADADTTTAGWTPNFYQVLGSAGIMSNVPTPGGSVNPGLYVSTNTSFDLGSGDFTLEAFVRFQSLPTGSNTKAVIFSRWDTNPNQRSYELFLGSTALNGGCLEFQTSTDGTVSTVAQPIVYPWAPTLDTWYHIAIVRASSQDLLFVNGQQFGLPIADTNTYFTGISPLGIGGEASAPAGPIVGLTTLTGWFNQARVTVGYARYTANFTPTTTEWPTGSGDPHWSDVSLLVNSDSNNLLQDTSSYVHTLQPQNGTAQQTVNDGPAVGSWSTVGKAAPDDNTFLSAPFTAATSILTVTVNPSNGNSVTVGTKDGTVAAVYTFKTTLASAFDVLIDTNIQNTLQNLYNAINAGPGIGTKSGTGTTSNFNVFATQLPAGQMMVTALAAGTGGNSVATSKSGITGSWTGTTLAGGANIPGPSNFKLQRLPPTTTIVSAIQIMTRAFKSDASTGTINTALIGALGGVSASPTHALTISPSYYNDIHETDPDTSGPISPTTLANGAIQITRDT